MIKSKSRYDILIGKMLTMSHAPISFFIKNCLLLYVRFWDYECRIDADGMCAFCTGRFNGGQPC